MVDATTLYEYNVIEEASQLFIVAGDLQPQFIHYTTYFYMLEVQQ